MVWCRVIIAAMVAAMVVVAYTDECNYCLNNEKESCRDCNIPKYPQKRLHIVKKIIHSNKMTLW